MASESPPVSKRQICDLWDVEPDFIDDKIRAVVNIIGPQNEDIILKHLNCNGMSVENAISAFFEAASENNEDSQSHNHNRKMSPSESVSASIPTTPRRRRRSCRKRKRSSSSNNVPAAKKRRISKMMNSMSLNQNDSDKENQINKNDESEKEATNMIVGILKNQISGMMSRDKLLTAVDLELLSNGKPKWRKLYQHKLGHFDDFIKGNNRFLISGGHKRDFLVEINENFEAEEAKENESESGSDDTISNANDDDENGDVYMNDTEEKDESMSHIVIPNDNSRRSEFSTSSSFTSSRSPTNNVFARYRYENGKNSKRSSKEERDSDSDYDSSDTTNNAKKLKKSMKAEADSDDDTEDEEKEYMNDASDDSMEDRETMKKQNKSKKLTPKRQLYKSPKRQLFKSKPAANKDENWKTKMFHPFKFKYTVGLAKKRYEWEQVSTFNDIKPIETKREDHYNTELYKLRTDGHSFLSRGQKVSVEYNKTHISNKNVVLEQLYNKSYDELYRKPIKPKPKKKKKGSASPNKKDRHDWTIQSGIKKTKCLKEDYGKKTKKYSAEIEFTLHKLAKTGNCFPVDIPYTIALTSKSKELTEDIIYSNHIDEEFRELKHTETSVSCLNFACRYDDKDEVIDPFKYLLKCRLCRKSPTCPLELPCGHTFCYNCVDEDFDFYIRRSLPLKCSTCLKEFKGRNKDEFMTEMCKEQNITSCDLCYEMRRCKKVYDEDAESEIDLCRECIAKEENKNNNEEKDYLNDEEEDFYDPKHEKYELTITPFPYQTQSIEWMLERETDPIGLYKYLFKQGHFKNGESFFYSAVINRLVLADEMPILRGGFLCEEMGLGKTIECIALINANKRSGDYSKFGKTVISFKETALRKIRYEEKPKQPQRNRNNDDEEFGQKKKKKKKIYKFKEVEREYTYYKGKGTLIIGPVSLIGQWEHELDTRSNAKISYKRYYGNRSRKLQDYLNFDVVFTTYGVLAKEDGNDRKKHVLHRIDWHRIILDECHTIKNGATLQSIHINRLKGTNKWLLSGTPFNRPSDLFHQLKFIGIDTEYLNAMSLKKDIYNKAVIKIVKYFMMRHIKGQKFNDRKIVTMPEKEEDVIMVEFTSKQREYYDKLYATAKETFMSFKATGNIGRGSLEILSALGPARRACSGYIASIESIEAQLNSAQEICTKIQSMVEMNKDASKQELYEMAKEQAFNKDGACVICLEIPPEDPLQTPCNHIFCGECIKLQIRQNGNCAICRTQLKIDGLRQPYSEQKEEENEDNNNHNHNNVQDAEDVEMKENENENVDKADLIKFDAKIKCLVKELRRLQREKPNEKSLIFTSFGASLEWICNELNEHGIEHRTLAGNMTMQKRARNLKQFANDPEVKVFVLTVRTGAVGLTLTSANHVFMFEPPYNPALHRQAINRVYRLGQEKKVYIHTLIMKRSIEERIWNINKEKQKGDIDDKTIKKMYGNIREDKAATMQSSEIEKLFEEREESNDSDN